MNHFRYQAVDAEGRQQRGLVDARDRDEARTQLLGRGLPPIDLDIDPTFRAPLSEREVTGSGGPSSGWRTNSTGGARSTRRCLTRRRSSRRSSGGSSWPVFEPGAWPTSWEKWSRGATSATSCGGASGHRSPIPR